ncbi:MAG: hypothetical protein IH940_13075, partial [Acidobacteria bacterium]|nr:hypothetical protein [Acidobacteriota bacterium]
EQIQAVRDEYASLREAVELLARGDPLTETVKAELHGMAASRIEIVGPSGTSGTHVDMITQRFGRRPDCTTPPTSSPNARRVLIAAAVLCAAVTGAVLWSEQPPVCDGIGCNGEQAR